MMFGFIISADTSGLKELGNLRMADFFKTLKNDLIYKAEQNIANEVDIDGKPFPGIQDSTLYIRKKRKNNPTNSTALLNDSGRLLSEIRAVGSWDVRASSLTFRARLFYMGIQQFGNRKNLLFNKHHAPIPERPYIGYPEADVDRIVNEKVQQHVDNILSTRKRKTTNNWEIGTGAKIGFEKIGKWGQD